MSTSIWSEIFWLPSEQTATKWTFKILKIKMYLRGLLNRIECKEWGVEITTSKCTPFHSSPRNQAQKIICASCRLVRLNLLKDKIEQPSYFCADEIEDIFTCGRHGKKFELSHGWTIIGLVLFETVVDQYQWVVRAWKDLGSWEIYVYLPHCHKYLTITSLVNELITTL